MWLFLPIASLLIPAVIGILETDHNGLQEESQLRERNRDVLGNRIKESDVVASKIQRGTMSSTEKNENENNLSSAATRNVRLKKCDNPGNTQTNRDLKNIQHIGSDMRIFSKRSETVPLDSWHYLPSKFKNFSNKKRNLNFNPWGGKRVSLYRPITTIRRPIRVPFGSWGGKRGKEYLQSIINSQMKKSKYVNYQDDEGILFDGYNVKRMAEGGTGRKIPFNSWGGKRSEEVDDLHQKQVTLMMDNNVDSNEKYTRNNIEGDFPDGNNVKNAVDKRVEQTKLKSHTKFSSWGGKRNSFDYQPLSNPITANNETSNDYTTKEETDGSDWLIFIPDKRTDGGQHKNINFYPWGGKRSSETLVFPIDDDYIETLAESMK